MSKINTSMEQSQKLIKMGINISTADMYFNIYQGLCFPIGNDFKIDWEYIQHGEVIPAWSLSALLDYLCSIDMFPTIENNDNQFKLILSFFEENEEHPISDVKTIIIKNKELVDACVEMIVKLKNLDCYESKNKENR